MKGIKIFLKKKKTKSNNTLVKHSKIFLKKKKKKSISIAVNHKSLSEGEKQRISERRRNYYLTRKK